MCTSVFPYLRCLFTLLSLLPCFQAVKRRRIETASSSSLLASLRAQLEQQQLANSALDDRNVNLQQQLEVVSAESKQHREQADAAESKLKGSASSWLRYFDGALFRR
jgi:hypothetical protein